MQEEFSTENKRFLQLQRIHKYLHTKTIPLMKFHRLQKPSIDAHLYLPFSFLKYPPNLDTCCHWSFRWVLRAPTILCPSLLI